MKDTKRTLVAFAFVLGACAAAPELPPHSGRGIEPGAPKVVARLYRPIYLWCHEPGGTACEAAAGALGVAPVAVDQIPEELLHDFQDLPNDCDDEQVQRLRASLEGPLGLRAQTSWADQVGNEVSRSQIGERYEGGGCITSGQGASPTVKIHIQPQASPSLALVRVWEPR